MRVSHQTILDLIACQGTLQPDAGNWQHVVTCSGRHGLSDVMLVVAVHGSSSTPATSMRPSNPRMIAWSHLSNALLLFIPLLISAKWPILRIHSFTPKQIIYSNNLIPLLLAPWSWPTTVRATLSRLIQATLLVKVSNDIRTPIKCYALSLLVGLSRTLTGFLLSRSVGWAYPKLFNHYALYETISGFGPALVVYLSLTGHAKSWAEYLTSRWSVKYSVEDRGSVFIALLSMLLSWLDDAPWTYTMAPICTLSLVLLRAILWRLAWTQYHPMALDPPEKSQPTVRMRAIMQTILLSLLVIPQPSLLGTLLYPIPKHLSLPPRARSPLLEILILSHPRPTDIDLVNITYSTIHTATSTQGTRPGSQIHKPMPSSILHSTICSYLSFLPSETDSSTRLSVFTHTLPHPAFTHAQQYFSPTPSRQHKNIPLEFYVDMDTHPEAKSGQYLHLAEALKWAYDGKGPVAGQSHNHTAAEWVLVVEDDFALCGQWGWDSIVRVMWELESGRIVVDGKETLRRWGGFVATGGRYVLGFYCHSSSTDSVTLFVLIVDSLFIVHYYPFFPLYYVRMQQLIPHSQHTCVVDLRIS